MDPDLFEDFVPYTRERFRFLEAEYGFTVGSTRRVAFRDIGWVDYRNGDRLVRVEGDHEGGSTVEVVFDPKQNRIPRGEGIVGPLLLRDTLALRAPSAIIALADADSWLARSELVAKWLPRAADDLLRGDWSAVAQIAELQQLRCALREDVLKTLLRRRLLTADADTHWADAEHVVCGLLRQQGGDLPPEAVLEILRRTVGLHRYPLLARIRGRALAGAAAEIAAAWERYRGEAAQVRSVDAARRGAASASG
jgi:hypothetical protein